MSHWIEKHTYQDTARKSPQKHEKEHIPHLNENYIKIPGTHKSKRRHKVTLF